MSYTDDLSDGFFSSLKSIADEVEANPADLAAVMFSESGLHSSAKNPAGAYGILQFTGLPGLGYTDDPETFLDLSAEEQLPYVRKYFLPHKGQLGNVGAVYTATFLPALLSQANEDPDFVLAGQNGPYAWAYNGNKILDAFGSGEITPRSLEAHVQAVTKGSRWDEVLSRLGETPTYSTPLSSGARRANYGLVLGVAALFGAASYAAWHFLPQQKRVRA